MTDEDLEALAAEYVLGTLTGEERATAAQLAAKDAGFAGRIAGWERRLGPLEAMVAPVEPPPDVWQRVRARVADVSQGDGLRLPELAEPAPARAGRSDDGSAGLRVRRWRSAAVIAAGLAAVLLLGVGLQRYRPDLLPRALRPPVDVKTVEVPTEVIKEVLKEVETPVPAGRFMAVLPRDAGDPAFLLTVDLERRTMIARRVGATGEPGRIHELWLVHDRFAAPRSLGLAGAPFSKHASLGAYDPETIRTARYAVSLEPEGGSPSGEPTGPLLFIGKLIEVVPSGRP